MLRQIFSILFMAILIFSLTGCDSSNKPSFGTLTVWLHDDPADFEEVQIFVERVEVNRQEDDEGWIVIGEPEQHFDLLQLTNGNFEVLGSEQLETGTYSQIRLIVNRDNNFVIENGEEKSLFVPSGSETGVKLNLHEVIEEGNELVLLLDFDVNKSIVKPGQSNQPAEYLLKPVIRATNLANAGHISGLVSPVDARPAVYAIAGSNTVSSTFADVETGEFQLFGLQEGSYTVSVNARAKGFATQNIDDVNVTKGETEDLGEIELESENQ